MTQSAQEQFAAAQKSHADAFFGLTNKVFDGFEKLTVLNLQAAKSIIADTQEAAQKVLSGKDPQDLLKLQTSLTQPSAEKTQAYGRHAYEILSATHAEFIKFAEARFSEYSQSAQTFVDSVTRNAPAGSESAVALLKSTITAAQTAFDSVKKATGQAVEIAESNFDAATTAASKAAKDSAAQASRTAKAA
ncbi:phasin family protein [Paraburkholderia phenazinium]|jgi:phasin family protein|uniref:Phasin family protein n=1 Tax=Paraburkholderia phenazinium TaxID=60549 RepID=A0A1G7S3J7_9BURK|nr:phasin family protein [Paraburkholderia phenazinium]SDG16710.1 phasin family protein [Paraburkholderia phenazinium]